MAILAMAQSADAGRHNPLLDFLLESFCECLSTLNQTILANIKSTVIFIKTVSPSFMTFTNLDYFLCPASYLTDTLATEVCRQLVITVI